MACILLAEDDDSLRLFLAKALTRAGHAVVHCGDGNEAMTEIDSRSVDFDLLLADIVMPGLDGIELARRANETMPDGLVRCATPKCCRSRSICGIWWIRSTRFSQHKRSGLGKSGLLLLAIRFTFCIKDAA